MGQKDSFKRNFPFISQLAQWLSSQCVLILMPVEDNWWALKVLHLLYMFKVRDVVSELKWIGVRSEDVYVDWTTDWTKLE